jgi:hypothetical protein
MSDFKKSKVMARDVLEDFDTEKVAQLFEQLGFETLHKDLDNSQSTEHPEMIPDQAVDQSDVEFGVPSKEEIEHSIRENIERLFKDDDIESVESGHIRVERNSIGRDMDEIKVKFIAEESGIIVSSEED